MRVRACIAILVACVICCGDGTSRWTGGNSVVQAAPASVQHGSRADRTFAVRRVVQRAVWVDAGSHIAASPAGICAENSAVCAGCAPYATAIEMLDPCARANRRIAF